MIDIEDYQEALREGIGFKGSDIQQMLDELATTRGEVEQLQSNLTAAREKEGLISRQGIEIMNLLEDNARQAEELELLRSCLDAVRRDAPELKAYMEWRAKQNNVSPKGL